MACAEDRQRMMDEGLVFWIDSIRASILEYDPTALVPMGFVRTQEPHPARTGDPRWIHTSPAILYSTADFIDLRPYPKAGLNLSQYMDNFEMAGMEARPIIMGEFGTTNGSTSTAQKVAQ
jgi:hypothetical protein